MYQPLSGSSVVSTSSSGAVRSILMPPTVAALLVARLVGDRGGGGQVVALAVDRRVAGAAPSRPERASEAVQCDGDVAAYQPAAFGLVVAAPLSDGAVVSTSMSATVSLAGVAGIVGRGARDGLALALAEHLRGRDRRRCRRARRSARKETVTSPSYQPAALAARSAEPLTLGAVLSRFTIAGSVAVLPALSVAVPVTSWASPSSATTWSGVHDAMPETASAQVNLTVTSLLFQPLAFGAGASVCEIVGVLPSIFTSTVLCASSLPALSTLQYSSVCDAVARDGTDVPRLRRAAVELGVGRRDAGEAVVRVERDRLVGGRPAVGRGGARVRGRGVDADRREAADFVLPALSATVLVTLWFAPSVANTAVRRSRRARPERASAAVHSTVTGRCTSRRRSGLLAAAALSVGAVLSMLMPDSVLLPSLPATSFAVPVADWSAPSASTFGADVDERRRTARRSPRRRR